MSAALLRLQVVRCRSKQLSEMLILPPPNHSACGGFHLSTVSHFLNQCSSSAMRAQNASGFDVASARRFSSSSSDLICACFENDSGGGKTRSSMSTESMLLVTVDTEPSLERILGSSEFKLLACLLQHQPKG